MLLSAGPTAPTALLVEAVPPVLAALLPDPPLAAEPLLAPAPPPPPPEPEPPLPPPPEPPPPEPPLAPPPEPPPPPPEPPPPPPPEPPPPPPPEPPPPPPAAQMLVSWSAVQAGGTVVQMLSTASRQTAVGRPRDVMAVSKKQEELVNATETSARRICCSRLTFWFDREQPPVATQTANNSRRGRGGASRSRRRRSRSSFTPRVLASRRASRARSRPYRAARASAWSGAPRGAR